MRRLLRLLLGIGVLPATAASGAGTKEVYVWQRRFDVEVVAALLEFAPQLDGACVLAAEVGWINGAMHVTRVPWDFSGLANFRKPLGLALRLGDYAGNFERDDETSRALATLARESLAKAAAKGVSVAELQIDFDCATSKLAGYRAWMAALRDALVGTRTKLVFTALPAWLGHPEFAPLARTAEGFVLQVHSLTRPTNPDATYILCDPARALAWAQQAGAMGVPFRVALPTYSYVLGFDPAGKFFGVAAEGPEPEWPAGTSRRIVRADAPAMARLARALHDTPPPHCTGVIWFRLPVSRDRYNWDPATLTTILRDGIPVADVRVEVVWSEPGLAEVVIVNQGQTTEPLPRSAAVHWAADARVLAADGLGGFRLEIPGGKAQGIARAADGKADAFLAPGRKTRIAWLRFAHEVILQVSFPAAP